MFPLRQQVTRQVYQRAARQFASQVEKATVQTPTSEAVAVSHAERIAQIEKAITEADLQIPPEVAALIPKGSEAEFLKIAREGYLARLRPPPVVDSNFYTSEQLALMQTPPKYSQPFVNMFGIHRHARQAWLFPLTAIVSLVVYANIAQALDDPYFVLIPFRKLMDSGMV